MIRFSSTVTYQYDTPFSPFPAKEYEKALDWLAESGFDSAEICISNYKGVNLDELKKGLDRRGLGCSTISTGQARGLEGLTLTDSNPEIRKQARARIMEHIDAAAFFGSHVTIGLLRGLGDPARVEEQTDLFMETMTPCLDYADRKEVFLLIEPINRYETALFNSVESVAGIIEKMGCPLRAGFLWDVFHANIEDRDYKETVSLMGNRLKHVHFADSNRHFPGFGHLDFDAFYDLLKSSGFDGHISFECLNLPDAETVKKNAAEFISQLKNRKTPK